jgi:acetyltransferase-like isoleucine patch superfamily enzyme
MLDRLLGRKHDKLEIHANVFISGWWNLRIGDNVTINRDCHVAAHGGLEIGNDVAIAPAVTIWTTEHEYSGPGPIRDQPMSLHPVRIGNDVWIGARVVILGGSVLPDGSIVGAGAVVTKPFTDAYTTIVGVPAKVIKHRKPPIKTESGLHPLR